MKTAQLIDQARQCSGIPSDYAMAKVLDISRQVISQWRTGISYPGNLDVFKLAELANRNPAEVIAELEAERAERGGKEDQAGDWRGMLHRLAAALLAAQLKFA